MNKIRILLALPLLGFALSGCRSAIDFENVDGQAEVNVGVVLPIGSIKFTVKDLLPTSADIYFDSVENKGVLTLKAHRELDRPYHDIDLSQYITTKQFNLPVYDQLSSMMLTPNTIYGDGEVHTISFPMGLTLEGINKDNSWERLDSAVIDSARFNSAIGVSNFNDLKWEYIEGIDLHLGGHFYHVPGNKASIYSKGQAGDFGQNIPIDLKNFTLCMMIKPNLDPESDFYAYRDNVYDTCLFQIDFKIRIPLGEAITVPNNAAITYDLGVQFIDYTAIWGMFEATDQMRDEDTIPMTDLFGGLGFIDDANLPFADPRINVDIITTVAGALVLNADYLFTTDNDNVKHSAEFNGQLFYEKNFVKGEYLDPIRSEIGDSTTNMHLRFDKDPAFGRIDRLFAKTPKELAYKWHLNFNFQKTPQIRITNNTKIRLKADAVLPMIFNQGVKVVATDTIKDIDLSQANIDSLIRDVNVVDTLKATDLKLFLTMYNTIPLTVKAKFRCLDAGGNEIMVKDEQGAMVPMQLFEKDTIIIDPPQMNYSSATWIPTPSQQTVLATVNKKMLDRMPDIKSIEYTLWIDDQALDYAYKQGNFNVKITDDAAVKLHIGLTARVEAIFNFANTQNTSK